MSTLDDALDAVRRTCAELDTANRAGPALGALAPAGYAIRALETALDLALRELGHPPIDAETAAIQGRRT